LRGATSKGRRREGRGGEDKGGKGMEKEGGMGRKTDLAEGPRGH